MIKVGIISFENPFINSEITHIGTPQGNILSPMLFNVYLTSLDQFIENLININNREGGKKIHNKEFRKRILSFDKNAGTTSNKGPKYIIKQINKDSGELIQQFKSFAETASKLKICRKELATQLTLEGKYYPDDVSYIVKEEDISKSTASLINEEKHRVAKIARSGAKRYDYPEDERPIKIHYVRYADDFLLGVNGPRKLAHRLKEEIACFIKSDLHFQCSTENVRHAYSD
jgi:hypothetical protein